MLDYVSKSIKYEEKKKKKYITNICPQVNRDSGKSLISNFTKTVTSMQTLPTNVFLFCVSKDAAKKERKNTSKRILTKSWFTQNYKKNIFSPANSGACR